MTVKVEDEGLFWKIVIPVLNWKRSDNLDRSRLEHLLIQEAIRSYLEQTFQRSIKTIRIDEALDKTRAYVFISKATSQIVGRASDHLDDFDFSTSFIKAFMDFYNPADVYIMKGIDNRRSPYYSLVILRQDLSLLQVYGPVDDTEELIDLIESWAAEQG